MTSSGHMLASAKKGNFRGSAVVGCFAHFEERYGRAAVHAVIAALSPEMRAQVSPTAPHLGFLPTKLYSYALIGAVVRAMIAAVRPADEDAFLAELARAGMDRTLTTVNRLMLHYMLTPERYAARAQEIWSLYHDCGVVTVLPAKPNEYRVQLTDWPNHDSIVCRISLEARRRSLEHMGAVIVEARRERCQSFGHDECTQVFRWSSLDGRPR